MESLTYSLPRSPIYKLFDSEDVKLRIRWKREVAYFLTPKDQSVLSRVCSATADMFRVSDLDRFDSRFIIFSISCFNDGIDIARLIVTCHKFRYRFPFAGAELRKAVHFARLSIPTFRELPEKTSLEEVLVVVKQEMDVLARKLKLFVKHKLTAFVEIVATSSKVYSETRGLCVFDAAKRGDVNMIRALLPKDAQISITYRGGAVKSASTDGHHECIEALLSGGEEISKADIAYAVAMAASGGYPLCIQVLLRYGEISEDNRGWAVVNASDGKLACIEALLAGNAPISDSRRIEALKKANDGGFHQCMEALLSVKPKISSKDFERMLGIAASRGMKCLQPLLSSGIEISSEARGLALMCAAGEWHRDCILALLAGEGEISEIERNWMLERAVGRGDSEIEKLLRKNGAASS